MKLEGAIFDMDGTLLDSMPAWDTVGSRYIRSRGIEPGPEFDDEFRNLSLRQAAERCVGRFGFDDPVEDIMSGINATIEGFYFNQVAAKPGVRAFLEALRERGINMCIATATDRYLVEAALRRCGLMEYFSAIFTCTEEGAGKEEPTIFETAMRHLGTGKEKTAVFEDALYAVRTAKAAGFLVVGVHDAAAADCESEIRSLSDLYVESLSEVVRYLD